MVYLDRFNLVSLKEIYTILKKQGYFNNTKTYQLCKFDLIVLLRNSKLFDETQDKYLLFYNPSERKWIKLISKRKLYDRGEKIVNMIVKEQIIVLSFN
tara:strand:+ start:915 stop:1208 length:294 start_codon:yes stop_codon:yes gene_type:complete